jgi:predicted small secreted protein
MGAQGWIVAVIIVCAVLIAARRPTRIAIIAVILIGITMYAFNTFQGVG